MRGARFLLRGAGGQRERGRGAGEREGGGEGGQNLDPFLLGGPEFLWPDIDILSPDIDILISKKRKMAKNDFLRSDLGS